MIIVFELKLFRVSVAKKYFMKAWKHSTDTHI